MTVDGLLVDFDDRLEVKVLVIADGELGLFQHVLQQLRRVARLAGRFRQGIEQFFLQIVRQPFGLDVDLKLGRRAERVLFGSQPDDGRKSGPLVGHQDGLHDSAVSPHRVLVVQQVVAGGPVMPFVLHEPHDLRGYFATAMRHIYYT